ncbi:MAG: methylated-DNA--[protein]-cysteine S-methyltransferase [Candidatus Humimicrobiaceae bacterium]
MKTRIVYKSNFNSGIGRLFYLWDENCRLIFLGIWENYINFINDLKNGSDIKFFSKKFEKLEKELTLYFAGKLKKFSVEVELGGFTDFERKVLHSLKEVEYGKKLSYSQLARISGYPKACRAVGSCMAKNPTMIIIPCHRIIKSDGSIGNFSSGIQRKEKLLKLERANL